MRLQKVKTDFPVVSSYTLWLPQSSFLGNQGKKRLTSLPYILLTDLSPKVLDFLFHLHSSSVVSPNGLILSFLLLSLLGQLGPHNSSDKEHLPYFYHAASWGEGEWTTPATYGWQMEHRKSLLGPATGPLNCTITLSNFHPDLSFLSCLGNVARWCCSN